jgi:hypothetical protein
LSLKSFNFGRDKYDLEGFTLIGTAEGVLPGVAGMTRVILKSDRESYGYFTYRCLYL